jgi:hypothetical protein
MGTSGEDELEKCARWAPAVDGRLRSPSILLQAMGVDRFDHSDNWHAMVQNLSRLGSHISNPTVAHFLVCVI